jgi:hypothetical protein
MESINRLALNHGDRIFHLFLKSLTLAWLFTRRSRFLTRLVMAENARGGAWSNLLLLLHLLHHFQSSVTTSKMNILELVVVFEPREGNKQRLEGHFHDF